MSLSLAGLRLNPGQLDPQPGCQIAIGDILLETTDGQKLALRRVARPLAEQRRILEALRLEMPERLSQDRLL